MARTKIPRQPSKPASEIIVQKPWGPVLTQWAFVLILALVGARALMTETLRDPTYVVPGMTIPPRGPGAATSLALDALCCLPALLILIRRIIEKGYAIKLRASHVVFAALAIWAAISTFWSSDKYAALLTSMHMLTAAVVIWTSTQLIRSWLRLRIIAGICFALLLAYLAHGLIYRFADAQQNIDYWNQYHAQIIKEHGWTEGSFEAEQFKKKLLSQEIIGFNQSPNSFAAVIVLFMVISAGAAIQRRADGANVGWTIAIFAAFPFAILLLYFTGSRTSAGTLLIAAAMLAAIHQCRELLLRRPNLVYLGGVAAAILVALAIIAHGIYHGSLPSASLAFRWRYWVASARLIRAHPILGVGWSNFGLWYTSVRLPIAAEEIKDPHNYILRAFVELGIVGGIVLLAWLARVAWEMILPVVPPSGQKGSAQARKSFGTIAAAVIGMIVVNLIASIDWSSQGAFVMLEVFRRLLFLGLMLAGVLIVTVRSLKDQQAEDAAAPWMLWGLVVGLAVFFVHNLVDFSLAEPGPLMIFALLVGATLGVRTKWTETKPTRIPAITALSIGAIVWLVFVLGLVLPVADAEGESQSADTALAANEAARAAGMYSSAYERMPLNADYAFKSARAMLYANEPLERAKAMLDTAIARDPHEVSYYTMRAALEAKQEDIAAARADYEQASALDPNSVTLHLEYAKMLEAARDRTAAAKEYQAALDKNDALDPAEPKRLPTEKVAEIQGKIAELTK